VAKRGRRTYQAKDNALRQLADRWRPAIRKDIKASLLHLGELVPVERSVRYARAGDWHALKAHINWQHFREVLKAPFARIIQVRHLGALLGVRKINGRFAQAGRRVRFAKESAVAITADRGGGTRLLSPQSSTAALFEKAVGDQFNFDAADEATQQAIRDAQDELISTLEAQARDAIDTIIRDGVAEGLSAEDMVDDIRGLIGLTDRQAQAVLNYEDMLHNLDPAALQRMWREPDYDAALQDAIDSGLSLSDTAISRMVMDYQDRALEARAEMIAQTESVRAASEGLHDAYAQAIDRGVLPADAVTRYWEIALDEATCAICSSIPEMNPDGVGVDEPFQSIDGPQDDPPDPHPNCRCSVEYVTDMDVVPEEE
jgi:hypothetical protein